VCKSAFSGPIPSRQLRGVSLYDKVSLLLLPPVNDPPHWETSLYAEVLQVAARSVHTARASASSMHGLLRPAVISLFLTNIVSRVPRLAASHGLFGHLIITSLLARAPRPFFPCLPPVLSFFLTC